MLDMTDRSLQQLANVLVMQVVDDLPAIALARHEPKMAKHAQLLRDGRRLHRDRARELANTERAAAQLPENADAARRGERLHRVSDGLRERAIEFLSSAKRTVCHAASISA